MSISEAFAKGVEGFFDKLTDKLDEATTYEHGLDLTRGMLETARMNPKPLSDNSELIDMKVTHTAKKTAEYQDKCTSMINFIDTFNGMEIPTKDAYKPDFIEVTNRSSMSNSSDYTSCNLDFRFNVLKADYVFEHRPDLMTRNHKKEQ